MNLKKCILICLSAILCYGNTFNVKAMKKCLIPVMPTIKMYIKSGAPVQLSLYVSDSTRLYLDPFLFGNQPWDSMPEKMKNCIIYSMGINDRLVDFCIMELQEIDDQEKQQDYSFSPLKIVYGNNAISIVKKILQNIQAK